MTTPTPATHEEGFISFRDKVQSLDDKSKKLKGTIASMDEKDPLTGESKGVSLGAMFSTQMEIQELTRLASTFSEILSALHGAAQQMIRKFGGQ